jgi:excisionase family DNA binding protein
VLRSLADTAPIDALRSALAAADDRTRLAVKLTAYAGLQPRQIAGLHTRHISEEHLTITQRNWHHKQIPLHAELGQELQAEIARRRRGTHGTGWSDRWVSEHGYLFPSDTGPRSIAASQMSRTVSSVLPDVWTTYCLRQTLAGMGERQAGQRLLYDKKSAAEQLSVHERTVERLIAAGELDTVRLGRGRLVPHDALDAYIERLRATG